MLDLERKSENIKSKEEFVEFMEALVQDFRNDSKKWGNRTLDSYLEGIQSWTEDMEGYYLNNNLPIPENVNWKVFAEILMAARIYE